jgi:hypothetical protein
MRFTNLRSAIILGVALVMTICVNSVRADQPPPIPAFYDGQLVTITVVNQNVVGITQGAVASVADPIYFFPADPSDPTGAQLQPHIIPTIPGVAGYNPHWQVKLVFVLNDRDLSTDPFLSEADVLEAEANGEVVVIPTPIIVLCQVISL